MTTAKSSQRESADRTLRTLGKGLDVLESIAAMGGSKGVAATDLMQSLSMDKSTLYRFLATLQSRGYVARTQDADRFGLGFRVLDLSASFMDGLELRDVARPFLEELAHTTGIYFALAVLDQDDVITVDKVNGTSPFSLNTSIGARRPTYCTATGKAMLAYVSEQHLDRILPDELQRYTENTITSEQQLREELRQIRRNGFAIDNGEYIEGIMCVAAPIFDFSRRAIGSASTSVLASPKAPETLAELGPLLRQAAMRISHRMGYRPLPSVDNQVGASAT